MLVFRVPQTAKCRLIVPLMALLAGCTGGFKSQSPAVNESATTGSSGSSSGSTAIGISAPTPTATPLAAAAPTPTPQPTGNKNLTPTPAPVATATPVTTPAPAPLNGSVSFAYSALYFDPQAASAWLPIQATNSGTINFGQESTSSLTDLVLPFQISNSTTSNCNLSSLTLPPAGFTSTFASGVLGVGSSQQFNVTVTKSMAGSFSGPLVLTVTCGSQTYSFNVQISAAVSQ